MDAGMTPGGPASRCHHRCQRSLLHLKTVLFAMEVTPVASLKQCAGTRFPFAFFVQFLCSLLTLRDATIGLINSFMMMMMKS